MSDAPEIPDSLPPTDDLLPEMTGQESDDLAAELLSVCMRHDRLRFSTLGALESVKVTLMQRWGWLE